MKHVPSKCRAQRPRKSVVLKGAMVSDALVASLSMHWYFRTFKNHSCAQYYILKGWYVGHLMLFIHAKKFHKLFKIFAVILVNVNAFRFMAKSTLHLRYASLHSPSHETVNVTERWPYSFCVFFLFIFMISLEKSTLICKITSYRSNLSMVWNSQ